MCVGVYVLRMRRAQGEPTKVPKNTREPAGVRPPFYLLGRWRETFPLHSPPTAGSVVLCSWPLIRCRRRNDVVLYRRCVVSPLLHLLMSSLPLCLCVTAERRLALAGLRKRLQPSGQLSQTPFPVYQAVDDVLQNAWYFCRPE